MINAKGRIVKTYDKIHMFDVNINKKETHRESDTFQAGSNIVLLNIYIINTNKNEQRRKKNK